MPPCSGKHVGRRAGKGANEDRAAVARTGKAEGGGERRLEEVAGTGEMDAHNRNPELLINNNETKMRMLNIPCALRYRCSICQA
jgi:hypothetical protein